MPASGRGDGRRRLLSRKPRAAIRPMAARGSLRFPLFRGVARARPASAMSPTRLRRTRRSKKVTVSADRLAATGCRGKLRVRGPGLSDSPPIPLAHGYNPRSEGALAPSVAEDGALNANVLEECCASARVRRAAAGGLLGIFLGGTHVDCHHDPSCARAQHWCDARSCAQADTRGRDRSTF